MNKTVDFPCRYCGSTPFGMIHMYDEIIRVTYHTALEANVKGNIDQYYVWCERYEQVKRQAQREGWNGHKYVPMDNLKYIEMKYDQANRK